MNDEMIICEDCTARIRESEIQEHLNKGHHINKWNFKPLFPVSEQ